MNVAQFEKGETLERVDAINKTRKWRFGLGIDSKHNYVLAEDEVSDLVLEESKFVFKGSGNIVFVGSGCHFLRSTITFYGDNSVAYFDGKSKDPVYMNLAMGCDCDFVMGGGYRISPFGPVMKIVVGERQKVLIGSQVLFSNAVTIRSGDSHGLYDLESGSRINEARSIMIGDHVWVGEDVSILKGSVLESGSVLGARALWSGKTLPANSVGGGNPGKVIKHDVFWERPGLNNRTKEYLNKKATSNHSDKFDYRLNPLPEWMKIASQLSNDASSLERFRELNSIDFS